MKNFDYQTPTRLIFGRDVVAGLPEVMRPFGRRILLTYGGGSIKRIGLYDRVKELLKDFEIFELGGIEPNPKYSTSVVEGVRICKEQQIDVILSVGGGSVLDCSKAIAGGAKYDGETWDLIIGKAPTLAALPIVDILTLAATGSEYDAGGVISRTETNDKVAYIDPHLFPACSFLDPTYTFTVNAKHAVARSGNKEIIGKLIQYGADLDATDNEGRTPLIRLLDNKRTDAALFLIEQGADTEITDNSGHKAIDYATAHGLKEVVIRLIVDGTSDIQGNTPLHQAVFNGQSEIVCLLLSTSPDMIDVTNDAGETPLLIACMKGNLTIVNLLIDAGAEVNKALLNGNTPLHFAAGFGNKFIGNSLIAAQALVNVKNKNGETPLILASREGNNEFVALLVAHGADVNLVDNFQQTALYYAGERGYNEIVETLLMAGAEG